jgi:glycosyltransferase involved in cell wall biosynthesis
MLTSPSRPALSVIVPNYNHSPYLKERLDSIINQTFQDFELIILDDASTDNSLEVIKATLGNRPYRLEVNEQNSGSTFRQWDKGISMAKGDLIWIAESDDVAECNFLQKMVNMIRSSDASFVYCQSIRIDSKSKQSGSLKGWTDLYSSHFWANDFVLDGTFFAISFLAIKCVIPNASAVVFQRRFYQSPTSIIANIKLIGDWVLWSHMAIGHTIAHIAEPLNHFRFHSATVRQSMQSVYFKESVICTSWILNITKAWRHSAQLVYLRQHLLDLWFMIGLEPASPANLIRNRKALRILFRLHGLKLLIRLARRLPVSLIRISLPLRMYITLGSKSLMKRLFSRYGGAQ